MNTRKLKNLRFQFGPYAPGLDLDAIRDRMVDAGLIILLEGERYAETPKMREMPLIKLERLLHEVLGGAT